MCLHVGLQVGFMLAWSSSYDDGSFTDKETEAHRDEGIGPRSATEREEAGSDLCVPTVSHHTTLSVRFCVVFKNWPLSGEVPCPSGGGEGRGHLVGEWGVGLSGRG